MTNEDQTPDASDSRKSHFGDIVSGVFGLVLALGAFSITTVSLESTAEVWEALGIYTPAFFFVLAIWQITGELFDRYPNDDQVFYLVITIVLFLTTLAPVFLNLLLDEQRAVQRLSATLFPLAMACVFGLLTYLWLRLARLIRRQGKAVPKDIHGIAVAEGVLTIIFLASLLVPYEPGETMWRALVWFAAFIVPNTIARLFRRRQS